MLSKLQQSKKGFTLIELMIVVAIIGILAAIAIPNFLRFQAKSKQSEAKTNLGGIFTAEIAYFGEKNVFGDLNVVSWAPIGDVEIQVHGRRRREFDWGSPPSPLTRGSWRRGSA